MRDSVVQALLLRVAVVAAVAAVLGSPGVAVAASGPAIELAVVPVVGDGPGDGDLFAADGMAHLAFTPENGFQQSAVHEYVVTNTGDVPVEDVEIADDRVGIVLDGDDGTVLQPGEAVTVRATMDFSFPDAQSVPSELLATPATATARTGSGDVVSSSAQSTIAPVVLIAPIGALDVDLAAVPTPDVVFGGSAPVMTWTIAAARAGETRTIGYRVRVGNPGVQTVTGLTGTLEVAGQQVDVAFPVASLAPGEETAVTVTHDVRADDLMVMPDVDASTLVSATATVEGADPTGTGGALGADDAIVRAVVHVPDARVLSGVVTADPDGADGALPAAGLGTGLSIVPLVLLLVAMGAAALRFGATAARRS